MLSLAPPAAPSPDVLRLSFPGRDEIVIPRVPMPFSVAAVRITPEIAEALLAKDANSWNRGLLPANKQKLIVAMRENRFVGLNGATLVLGADGRLVDGQHRLRAIIASGKAQDVTLVYGMPSLVKDIKEDAPERIANALVVTTPDQGAARGRKAVGEILTKAEGGELPALYKRNAASRALGLLRAAELWGSYDRAHSSPLVDNVEEAEFIGRFPLLTIAANLQEGAFRGTGIKEACFVLASYLFPLVNGPLAEEFLSKVLSKDPLDDSSASHLRKLLAEPLLKELFHQNRVPDIGEQMGLFILAWNLFIRWDFGSKCWKRQTTSISYETFKARALGLDPVSSTARAHIRRDGRDAGSWPYIQGLKYDGEDRLILPVTDYRGAIVGPYPDLKLRDGHPIKLLEDKMRASKGGADKRVLLVQDEITKTVVGEIHETDDLLNGPSGKPWACVAEAVLKVRGSRVSSSQTTTTFMRLTTRPPKEARLEDAMISWLDEDGSQRVGRIKDYNRTINEIQLTSSIPLSTGQRNAQVTFSRTRKPVYTYLYLSHQSLAQNATVAFPKLTFKAYRRLSDPEQFLLDAFNVEPYRE